MRNKTSWLERIIVGIGSILGSSNALAEEIAYVANPTQSSTKTIEVEPKSGTSFYIEQTLGTNYVFSGSGAIVAKKDPRNHSGVSQTYFGVTRNNITGWIWGNYDFEDAKSGNGFHELDAGIEYTQAINDFISVTGGGAVWMYPSEFLGENSEYIVYGKTSLKTMGINFDIAATNLFAHDKVSSGQCYTMRASKNFDLCKIAGFNVVISPRIEGGFTDTFYDGQSFGLRAINTGADLTLSKKDSPLSVKFSYTHQDGKNGTDDFDYASVSFGAMF
ncbi:MAG: hypothetical protein WC548_02160 [Candidatus Pacearchaeota archaeon]